MYTDDPVKDFDRYQAEQVRYEQKFPICECCGNRIIEDYCYPSPDGDGYICTDCERERRISVDSLIEEDDE